MSTPAGRNVEVEVQDDKLVITVDLSEKGERSASGKTLIVGKTYGPTYIPEGDVTLNMQVWRK